MANTFNTTSVSGGTFVASAIAGRDNMPLLYSDALDHLRDYLGGSSSDVAQTLTRRCVVAAYNRLMSETDWRFLNTHGRINLVAPYSTGTVAFDLAGGAYDRLLTLSSGTWPTWAKYGRVKIGTVLYDVDHRIDNTRITLKLGLSPVEDIAAGTSYLIYRNTYPLPVDFKRLYEPSTERIRGSCYVPPEEFLWLERHQRQSGSPFKWTVMPSVNFTGEFAIYIYGYPVTTETLDFLYQRSMRFLLRSGYEAADYTGTITIPACSMSVVGNGTTFAGNMVGAYMRFADNATTVPTGLGDLYPFAEQRKIRSVSSATALTLDEPVENSYTTTKFRVSDPLDLPQYMAEAYFACLEWHYAKIGRTAEGSGEAFNLYKQELIKARESDSVAIFSRAIGGTTRSYDQGWRTAIATPIE